MAPVTHGGRALRFAREHNIRYADVVDFSANVNPLGPSPKALDAIRHAMDLVRFYPDENPVQLVRAFSDRLHIPRETILAGNGATELLYFWLRTIRPRTATLIVPTFVEYRKALESIGTEIQAIHLHADNNFRLSPVRTNADVVIVTNPNNPAGAYAPLEEMLEWIAGFSSSTHVFIDEAFVEFTGQPSLIQCIDQFPNLWVLRSMTKFYALPGLRLGYLVGSGVRALQALREPWQVNALAEVAGIASLQDLEHEKATLQLIQRERAWLLKNLQTVRGIRLFPTAANFVLARCEQEVMLDTLIHGLAKERILIRDCRHIEGLQDPCFRFAIRTRPENALLLDQLRRL